MDKRRCPWAKDKLEKEYHDKHWGIPEHNDIVLFEFLILEGMQAGLSWRTVLAKRDGMREAFDNFDPRLIQNYTDNKVEDLIGNPNIIRNKLKIKALKDNALSFIKVQKKFGSFDNYLWGFVNYEPIVNSFEEVSDVPTQSNISDKISKDLKSRGFKFVGSTTVYAYMQAMGLVNDHMVWCDFR